MTLGELQGHLLIVSLYDCDFSYRCSSCQDFKW